MVTLIVSPPVQVGVIAPTRGSARARERETNTNNDSSERRGDNALGRAAQRVRLALDDLGEAKVDDLSKEHERGHDVGGDNDDDSVTLMDEARATRRRRRRVSIRTASRGLARRTGAQRCDCAMNTPRFLHSSDATARSCAPRRRARTPPRRPPCSTAQSRAAAYGCPPEWTPRFPPPLVRL